MIEETDEVTETVVVDNSSEIQALKKVAYMSLENAFQTGVWDVVAINFQKVLEKDPTDWRGNFYPHFIDYKNAIASPDVNRIVKQHDIIKESYRMAISLIKETESEENQKTCYQEVFAFLSPTVFLTSSLPPFSISSRSNPQIDLSALDALIFDFVDAYVDIVPSLAQHQESGISNSISSSIQHSVLFNFSS